MIRLYWIEGRLDGQSVAGFQLAPSRAEARRLARHFAGVKRGRGRPRKGQSHLEIVSIEVAG
jgi:hypothetical protein